MFYFYRIVNPVQYVPRSFDSFNFRLAWATRETSSFIKTHKIKMLLQNAKFSKSIAILYSI